jgi:hypothetical protein
VRSRRAGSGACRRSPLLLRSPLLPRANLARARAREARTASSADLLRLRGRGGHRETRRSRCLNLADLRCGCRRLGSVTFCWPPTGGVQSERQEICSDAWALRPVVVRNTPITFFICALICALAESADTAAMQLAVAATIPAAAETQAGASVATRSIKATYTGRADPNAHCERGIAAAERRTQRLGPRWPALARRCSWWR